jgi:hypothetical protein
VTTAGGAYAALTREELEVRLRLAEHVCLMYGWSPARVDTDREKACHELWRRWTAAVPEAEQSRKATPHLSEDVVRELAAQRDATRATTLRRLHARGDQAVSDA